MDWSHGFGQSPEFLCVFLLFCLFSAVAFRLVYHKVVFRSCHIGESSDLWLWCLYGSPVVSVASPSASILCRIMLYISDISVCCFVRFLWYFLSALVLFLVASMLCLMAYSYVSIVSPITSPQISSKAFCSISSGLTRNIICFLWWFLWLLSQRYRY